MAGKPVHETLTESPGLITIAAVPVPAGPVAASV
jgi:hypothetical protein